MIKGVLTSSVAAFFSLMTITSHAEPIVGPTVGPIKVVLDITRGIQQGCAYQGTEKLKCFKISGGRNQAQTFKSSYGEVRYCSFTTAATEITPQLIQRQRKSNEFNVALEYFISFDEVRGVGTHAGDTSTYSGSCIRIGKSNAKFLYDLVKDNSVIKGQKIVSSEVKFDVIDNTKGRLEKECECLTDYLRHNSAHKVRAEKVCSGSLMGSDLLKDWLATMKPKVIRPKPRPADLFIPESYILSEAATAEELVAESPILEEYLVETSAETE